MIITVSGKLKNHDYFPWCHSDAVSLKKRHKSAEGKCKVTELRKCLTESTKNGAEIYHIKSSKGEKKKRENWQLSFSKMNRLLKPEAPWWRDSRPQNGKIGSMSQVEMMLINTPIGSKKKHNVQWNQSTSGMEMTKEHLYVAKVSWSQLTVTKGNSHRSSSGALDFKTFPLLSKT